MNHDHNSNCGCSHDHDREHGHHHTHAGEAPGKVETSTYAGNAIQFQYPRKWTLSEETGPDQTTITVQSPGTSYWMISLFEERPNPERIVASVMEAYRSLYEDLDITEPDAQFLGFPAITRELDFVCLDLVTTASMIAFQTPDHSVLVMFQGEDRELESTRPMMEEITRTLLCELNETTVGPARTKLR